MGTDSSYRDGVLEAIKSGRLPEFIAGWIRRDAVAFQTWLNADDLALHLFLPVASVLWNTANDALIRPAKQWIVEQYHYLKNLAKETETEPKSFATSPLELLKRHEDALIPRPFLSWEATRLVLEGTDSAEFIDDQHALLYEYHLFLAGSRPALDGRVADAIVKHPEFFSRAEQVSNLAVWFGPRIIRLYLMAMFSMEGDREGVILALHAFTGINGEDYQLTFEQTIERYFETNRDYLYINSDAVFPSGDGEGPLFEIDRFAMFIGKPQLTLYRPNRRISDQEESLRAAFAMQSGGRQSDMAEESLRLRIKSWKQWTDWMAAQRKALLNPGQSSVE